MTGTDVLDRAERLDALAEQFEQQRADLEAFLRAEIEKMRADQQRWAS